VPFLEIARVHKSYGNSPVLVDLSLSLEKHDVVCLIGASGSGKSTLLRCINALEGIDGGQISIEGQPMHALGVDLNFMRRQIGIVFQQFNLFPRMTVLENVTLAPRKVLGLSKRDATVRASDILNRVGLGPKASEYPDRLSGGQQQRVAIARALAMRPKLLLLDEVTSALDPELVGEVLQLVGELARQGMTLMLATHEMAFARDVADRIYFLAEGRIYEEGSAAELLGNPKRPLTQSFLGHISAAGRL
jgi:polar amino acid transport system ATP-binding protein